MRNNFEMAEFPFEAESGSIAVAEAPESHEAVVSREKTPPEERLLELESSRIEKERKVLERKATSLERGIERRKNSYFKKIEQTEVSITESRAALQFTLDKKERLSLEKRIDSLKDKRQNLQKEWKIVEIELGIEKRIIKAHLRMAAIDRDLAFSNEKILSTKSLERKVREEYKIVSLLKKKRSVELEIVQIQEKKKELLNDLAQEVKPSEAEPSIFPSAQSSVELEKEESVVVQNENLVNGETKEVLTSPSFETGFGLDMSEGPSLRDHRASIESEIRKLRSNLDLVKTDAWKQQRVMERIRELEAEINSLDFKMLDSEIKNSSVSLEGGDQIDNKSIVNETLLSELHIDDPQYISEAENASVNDRAAWLRAKDYELYLRHPDWYGVLGSEFSHWKEAKISPMEMLSNGRVLEDAYESTYRKEEHVRNLEEEKDAIGLIAEAGKSGIRSGFYFLKSSFERITAGRQRLNTIASSRTHSTVLHSSLKALERLAQGDPRSETSLQRAKDNIDTPYLERRVKIMGASHEIEQGEAGKTGPESASR